jgi:hypothetical protein
MQPDDLDQGADLRLRAAQANRPASTITSACARIARVSARRREPCVLRSSSPAQRSVGGVSSKRTIRKTYSNPPVIGNSIDQMSGSGARAGEHQGH